MATDNGAVRSLTGFDATTLRALFGEGQCDCPSAYNGVEY